MVTLSSSKVKVALSKEQSAAELAMRLNQLYGIP